MPPRKGHERVDVSLPTALVEKLTVLAPVPGVTRSSVMADALTALLEGRASQTLLETLHARLDKLEQAQGALEQTFKAIEMRLLGVEERIKDQMKRYDEFVGAVRSLYTQEKARPPQRHTWSKLFG